MVNKNLQNLLNVLHDKKLTLAFAESMTAGRLVNEFSKCTGAADVLLGGVVTYKPEMKITHLNVKEDTLNRFTAESKEVTTEMVHGLKKLISPDIAVAVTGLASPGASESDAKPVGTVFVSILNGNKLYEYRTFFEPDNALYEEECKEDIMLRTVNFTVERLLEINGGN